VHPNFDALVDQLGSARWQQALEQLMEADIRTTGPLHLAQRRGPAPTEEVTVRKRLD
jgi:hypothetical protein